MLAYKDRFPSYFTCIDVKENGFNNLFDNYTSNATGEQITEEDWKAISQRKHIHIGIDAARVAVA